MWVSQQEVLAARSARGGWKKTTLSSWGVGWPPPGGWQRLLTTHGRGADPGTTPDPRHLQAAAALIPATTDTRASSPDPLNVTTATTAAAQKDRCPVPTRKGEPCPIPVGPRGLCHVHDPDGAFAQQHPATRAALLQRPEVQAAIQRTVTASTDAPHAPTDAPAPAPEDRCEATTRSGRACASTAGPRRLCHIHDPDAAYAQQHPATRAALLQRDDIRAALQRASARAERTPETTRRHPQPRDAAHSPGDDGLLELEQARAAALAALHSLDEDALW